jgi:hypothetical protein
VGDVQAEFGRQQSKSQLIVTSGVHSPSVLWRLIPRL